MFWWTFTASPQLLRCISRLCFGTSPLFIVYYCARAHSFLHSDLIIIYMLMTPSCSYPSRQPSSVITFPVCRLVLAPSQTGWPQICSVSTAQRLNSCCWVWSLSWIKYKVLHFVWVMVSLFFLQPQLAISVFWFQCYPNCWPDLFCFSILFLSHSRSSTHSPCSRLDYCSVYWHIFCSFQAWLLLYYGLPKIQLNLLQHIQTHLLAPSLQHPGLLMPTRFWKSFFVPNLL